MSNKTVKEAYEKAYREITSKGYMTQSRCKFSEGEYIGYLYLWKRATWKSPISAVWKVRKKYHRLLLKKEDKKLFMDLYVKGVV